MKKMRLWTVGLFLVGFASSALCDSIIDLRRKETKLSEVEFDALNANEMDPKLEYHAERIVEFDKWHTIDNAEATVLSLYPGYVEPVSPHFDNGVEKLTIFTARFKIKLNRPSSQIQPRSLLQLDRIAKFDPEIHHIQIGVDGVITNQLRSGNITSFNWCNSAGPMITRPQREQDLSSVDPKTGGWCTTNKNSICLESCYLFGYGWQQGVKVANSILSAKKQKDFGIASQSQIRVFDSEAELGWPFPASTLTHLSTPVRGGFEQSLFYFNQVIQFGKIFAVLQDAPDDPHSTIMSTIFTVAIKSSSLKGYPELKKVILGTSSYFGTSTGLTAGLPIYTRNMVERIAEQLEN